MNTAETSRRILRLTEKAHCGQSIGDLGDKKALEICESEKQKETCSCMNATNMLLLEERHKKIVEGEVLDINAKEGGASAQFEDVRTLVDFCDEHILQKMSKEDLVGAVQRLSREVLASRDLTCGPDTAARFFNRKRSWIYEAMSRPGTPLQHSLQKIAAREPGGLLFRLSDLVRLRRQLFGSRREI